MKLSKRVLWAFAALAVLAVIFVLVFWKTAMRVSPPDTVSFNSGDLSVEVHYSRPFVKNRLIFGEEKDGALQPYGKYWRAGANEATRISFSQNVLFAGQPVPAGEYSLYAIPGADSWEIALNSQARRWGFDPPDIKDDVARVMVSPNNSNPHHEQFTITLNEAAGGVDMLMEWGTVRVVIPVRIP